MTLLQQRRVDTLLPVVAEVMSEILAAGDVVAPIDVLVRLEAIDPDQVELWRGGSLPYLERGITAGLARVSRLLRLIREHALASGLEPVPGKYRRRGKSSKQKLRFSKRGDRESELAYSTHFVRRKAPPEPASG
jgi:hypothetical protein